MKNKYPFSGVLVRFVLSKKKKSIQGPQPSIENDTKAEKIYSYGNELHVNIWDFESSDAVIDVGIMVKEDDDEEISAICVDVPWEIPQSDIFDIASRIDGEKVLEAIFNRDAGYESSSQNPAARYPKVSFSDERGKDFLLVRLNYNQIKVEKITIPGFNPVTRITLTPDFQSIKKELKTNKIDRYYFRVRLLHVPRKIFRIIYDQKDKNLLSSCVEETVFDFRLNARRGIPQEILYPTAAEFDYPGFNQIHLFLISHRDKQPSFQSKNFKTCRSLEDESVWNDYIRLDDGHGRHSEKVNDYLGYQWSEVPKDSKRVREMAVLGRFSRVTSNRWTMLRFVLLALLFGAASNGFWSVWERWTPSILEYSRIAKYVGSSVPGELSTSQYSSSILLLLLITVLLAYLNSLYLLLSLCCKHFKRFVCDYFCKRRS